LLGGKMKSFSRILLRRSRLFAAICAMIAAILDL
jgi:hypothetical protein